MDTTKIKAFLLAEKHKSFSKVAQEFSYTPSALSHMADALEKELGVKLFDRTHNGVRITEAGRQLLDKFQAVVDAEEALLSAAKQISQSQAEVLRIGTYSSIARHILPEILHSFKQAFPGVKTSVFVEDNIKDLLKSDALDVIFTDEYHTDRENHWYPIMEDRYMAVLPAEWTVECGSICKEQLYTFPFIQLDEEVLHAYFAYSEFKEIIQVQSIENETAVSMVKEKIGVTVVPELDMKHTPAGVKVLTLTPKLTRLIGIQYKRGNVSQATERFVRHIKKMYG